MKTVFCIDLHKRDFQKISLDILRKSHIFSHSFPISVTDIVIFLSISHTRQLRQSTHSPQTRYCAFLSGSRANPLAANTLFHFHIRQPPCYSAFLSGSCARIIAANISTHPNNSLELSFCPRITQPASTDTTDSKLRIRDAIVGSISFCPTICSV